MREYFWGRLAALLVRHKDRIYNHARKHPHHFQLGDYMSRWWILKRRWWLPLAIRMHHIKREDFGAHPHDHPGTFRTFILAGWYVEQRGDRLFYPRNAGDSALLPAKTYHKIVSVAPEGALTVVIEWGFWGKRWGFLKDGVHVGHEQYHDPR